LTDTTTKLIAGPAELAKGTPAPPADTTAAGRARTRAERFSVGRFSPRGDALLISNGEGQWVVDLGTNAREMVIATNDSNPATPRVTFAAWSDDGSKLYFNTASRTKERGIARYDRASKDRPAREGRRMLAYPSKDGNTAFSRSRRNRPGDSNGRR
jgi:Tol biopolymer transport system component